MSNLKEHFPFSPTRLGYWIADLPEHPSSVILVRSRDEFTRFQVCIITPSFGCDNVSGKDLHLQEPILFLPSSNVSLVSPAFALSLATFNTSKTWGANVFCLRTAGAPTDDGDQYLDGTKRFREGVLAHMTSNPPVKSLRRFTLSMCPATFHQIFDSFKPQKRSASKSFGQWTYHPSADGSAPQPPEFCFVAAALRVHPSKAFALVKEAREKNSPIILQRGQSTILTSRKKRLEKQYPEALKSQVFHASRDRTEFFFTELDTDEILRLEGSVGPFTKKAARGSSTPTRIIGPKKPDDPEYVPECKMKITFQPNKLQLAVQFNYIIRDELGRAY